ncbi:type II toxin-antitoxin system RelE/ParE family toxin [Brevundimonas sp.]|uniref:type II toxin-antitoxin system RelE/ParE family toxin n=1 Tax=Brevundimonas sp. TaxID=1871086 RepID=UPI001A2A8BD3|nr:type II toxin-antitoxin system RelE/ParE family toxin [Brevundimonas sp.]MBJ7483690.1 type II toxin-antitoxin system RelE/ParE family toxin [Brevundimonas sp.]
MAEYRLSAAAERDLETIFDYTVGQWGLAQAVTYTDQIEEACLALAEAPLRSVDSSDIRPGYRRRIVGRHVVYFQVAPYGVAVIRILDQRMDAPRHL